MSTSKQYARRKTQRRTVTAKGRFGIYPSENGHFLFVPNEDQWNSHEASKPSAICGRAGLSEKWWWHARKRYAEHWSWLGEYLYGAGPWRTDAGLGEPTAAMLQFRKHATTRAILAAARRPEDRPAWRRDYQREIQESLLSYWRRKIRRELADLIPDEPQRDEMYRRFDRWLVRGEDLPANVTVVTAEQSRRVARALDFAAFCADLGICCDGTYVLWLHRGQIPDLRLLKWLYGFPAPDGVYVVSEALPRLRHEKGWKGILAALKKRGIRDQWILWRWQGDERTAGPINSILTGEKGKDGKGWERLDAETQRQMIVVEEIISLDACLQRAGLSRSQYYVDLQEAERCDAQAELLAYLASEGRYAPPGKKARAQDNGKRVKNRQCGLLAPNFFIPTPNMWRFRARAEEEGSRQRIWELEKLPGFDLWFAHWTAPKAHRGRRHQVSWSSAPASIVKEQNVSLKSPQSSGGADDPGNGPQHEDSQGNDGSGSGWLGSAGACTGLGSDPHLRAGVQQNKRHHH